MATYKGINGFAVQSLATDPTFDEGQVWYNNTTYAWKVTAISADSIATGGNINTARFGGGGAGTTTAALMFGGVTPGNYRTDSESYNGSSWTTTPSMTPGRGGYMKGNGLQTAALAFSIFNGGTTNFTQKYNGSSWSNSDTMNTSKNSSAPAGIQTAALASGGNDSGDADTITVESYNGAAWTSAPSLSTPRGAGTAGFGSNTSAIVAGNGPTNTTTVESYNGSSWTSAPSLNTGRSNAAAAGSSNTSGVIFSGGGSPAPPTSAIEKFNGTSWTTSPATNGPIYLQSPAAAGGPSTSTLIAGGNNPSTNATYIWSGSAVATKTITTS
jgi:hypothetical protein